MTYQCPVVAAEPLLGEHVDGVLARLRVGRADDLVQPGRPARVEEYAIGGRALDDLAGLHDWGRLEGQQPAPGQDEEGTIVARLDEPGQALAVDVRPGERRRDEAQLTTWQLNSWFFFISVFLIEIVWACEIRIYIWIPDYKLTMWICILTRLVNT